MDMSSIMSCLYSIVSSMNINWILLGALVINIFALVVNIFAFLSARLAMRRQVHALDLSSYFKFTEKFANKWRKFKNADEKDKEFEFVEVLNLLETASHLYNRRIIHGATRNMVRDYLREVIRDVFQNEYAKEVISKNHSGPDTYAHIRQFARSNNLDGIVMNP